MNQQRSITRTICSKDALRYLVLFAAALTFQAAAHGADLPDCQPGSTLWKRAVEWGKALNMVAPDEAKDADTLMGICYGSDAQHYGADGDRNFDKATEYFEKAIARGEPLAMFAYGFAYSNFKSQGKWDPANGGRSRPNDAEFQRIRSFSYALYERAAKLGSVAAQNQLCQSPNVVPGNDALKAAAYCLQAEAQGHPEATAKVAAMYAIGLGVPKDEAKSREFFKLATSRGDTQAAGNQQALQKELTKSTPAPAFVASDDSRAVFGLLVGGKAPISAPKCKEEDLLSTKPVMSATTPLCISMLGSSMEVLMGDLFGFDLDDYKAMGIVPVNITVNDKLYDTSITNGVTLFVDRDTSSIQRMKIDTLLVANDKVLGMLMRKFGKPAKQTTTTWTNRQSGAVANRTPNYSWEFNDMLVSYESKVAAALDNSPTILGRIDITTPAYMRLVEERNRKKNEPPPGRKPM